jgi:hypothetical protein
MNLWNRLWRDVAGSVLTTEAVLVGTVGVVGVVAGVSTLSRAVDEELKDVGFAIRSLDQSYGYCGQRGCCAWTAGSCFTQPCVDDSLVELEEQSEADADAIRQRLEFQRRRNHRDGDDLPRIDDPSLSPLPNELPESRPTEVERGRTPL